tara:strand:+ start:107 stop:814 length:708 start_codon:yes stop_codon:yes gene_type:complete
MENFDYDTISVGYYDQIFKKNKGIQSAWHHIKFDYVEKKISDTENHLDIGCGSGTFLGNYLRNKKRIGVDIASKQIEYAVKNNKDEKNNFFHIGKKLPFKDKEFDSISLIEIIEHLDYDDTKNLIYEAKRCLKDKGHIFITTPNYLSLWPLLELIVNKFSRVSYEDQHISKYNYFSLKKLLLNFEMKIVEMNTFITISPFIAFFSFKLSKTLSKLYFPRFNLGFLIFAKIKKNFS